MVNSSWTFFWSLKPWWCQPWSIIITGLLLAGLMWNLTQLKWLIIIISGVVIIWWLMFLVFIPTYYKYSFIRENTILKK